MRTGKEKWNHGSNLSLLECLMLMVKILSQALIIRVNFMRQKVFIIGETLKLGVDFPFFYNSALKKRQIIKALMA